MLKSWHPRLAEQIRQAREANGKTQVELASVLDCSDRAISFWECDRRRPTPTMLMMLNNLFGFWDRRRKMTQKRRVLDIIDQAMDEKGFWQRIDQGKIDLLATEFPKFAAKINALRQLDLELGDFLYDALSSDSPVDM